MKAPHFAYARPASVAEALALLAEYKDEARVLAGGQSLVPMMNFRVAAPKVLVDINRIAGLSGIKVAKNHLRIGALVRHAELERSADIAGTCRSSLKRCRTSRTRRSATAAPSAGAARSAIRPRS